MGFPDAKLLLRASAPPVKIIDVGGMSVGRDDFHESLVRAGLATVLGFEPVAAECERLNAGSDGARRYLPHAIGDGGEAVFRECNYPMTSSLYEPNFPLLEKFQALAEVTQVVRRTPVQTKRLDDIPEAAGADYLKLDVQGAELDVLRGADRLLDSLLVVQTEVVFVPLYRDQPLFADIDTVLRRRGFAFHRFLGVCGRAFKPFLRDGSPSKTLSQELWSDALCATSCASTRFRHSSFSSSP